MIILNKVPIEQSVFKGGEVHVKVPHEKNIDVAHIDAFLYNSNDVMALMLTVDALRNINQNVSIVLTIPYFPYARQDRVCLPGEAFSVRVMANMINSLHVENLTIIDPHSKITEHYLCDANVMTMADIFWKYCPKIGHGRYTFVAPDAGAEKKTRALADKLQLPAIYCTKVRNPETLEITETHIPDVDTNKMYLIVDDICDGGRTFIALSKLLQEKGVPKQNLELYVTHGIFSYGVDLLADNFNHIYCYHAFPDVDRSNPYLTILNETEN